MQKALSTLLSHKLPAPIEGALERILLLDRFNELYEETRNCGGGRPFVEEFLSLLQISTEIDPKDLALVPREGPVVAVANHPFGLVEGLALAAVLPTVRPDTRILANHVLSSMPEASQYCIFVDPLGGADAIRSNRRGMREAVAWLENKGLLAVFPAGEVAHWNLTEGAAIDPEWSRNVARIIRLMGATVLPVYFAGANSALFQLLGFLHPRMRTALLARELFNKRKQKIEIRIGAPISPAKLRTYQDDLALARYLRHRTYLLQSREATKPAPRPRAQAKPVSVFSDSISAEISKLGPDRTLVESSEFLVLLARADEIPNGLQEIGKLREVAFRQAGEGTGKELDIDVFDYHYWHLFLWHRQSAEIAGAYRLGLCDEIVAQHGTKGLYTNSLFRWEQAFLDRINPAVELGRSFVRIEYQKSYAPLYMLWKGIGRVLVRNPKYKVLFGAVSISNAYSKASRELMVTFLREFRESAELAPFVQARNPFRPRPSKLTKGLLGAASCEIEDLSAMIADVEGGRRDVPILLRQYLKLGGELVDFHVDRTFSSTLDGLIVVDLRRTDEKMLQRYLGKEGAASFLSSTTEPLIPG